MSEGYYDVALVCLNGHIINDNAGTMPVHNTAHCSKCGAETIKYCPSCKEQIRGNYEVPGVLNFAHIPHAPSFCHNCGHPYPWTEKGLQAAKSLADEFQELTPEERDALKGTLDDLVRDSAMTGVASTRFKKIMRSLGKESLDAMKKILVAIATESAKKSIFGG